MNHLIKQYISPIVIGDLARSASITKEAVMASDCDPDWCSSNPNRWTFAIHLLNGTVAIVYREDSSGFELGRQTYSLMSAEEYAAQFKPEDTIEDLPIKAAAAPVALPLL